MFYLRTIFSYALTLLAALTVNFLLPRLAPGNPVNTLLGSDVVDNMTPEQIAKVMKEFDLHLPLYQQYWNYVTGILSGNFGNSVILGGPVWDALMQRLPWTLLLMSCAMVFSTVIGTLLGIVAAWRRGEIADISTMGIVLFVGSLPPFWLAMLLITLFSTSLGWLPSFGAYQLGTSPSSLDWYVEVARRLVMPTLALGIVQAASVLLIARSSMTMALDQDYVTFSRAMGVPERRIFFRYAFRNAMLPLYTHIMMGLGSLVGGALVVETVFAYPGLGSLVVMGVNSRDYTLLQGLFVVATISIIAANLVTDIFYPLIDPRTRRVG